LKITSYVLSAKDCKAIGKYITDHQTLRELDLTKTGLTTSNAKEIADGLMRAKKVEILRLRDNPGLDAQQIIYNLAFSPIIKLIDLTNNEQGSSWTSTVEALFKLLKISGTIETLLVGNTKIGAGLSQDFFLSLGASKTMKHLNIDMPVSETSGSSTVTALARACAMNAYNGGQLRSLSMKRMMPNQHFASFIAAFWISEQDHENAYGDPNAAAKMKKDQLERQLNFKLDHLDLGFSNLATSAFKLKHYTAQKNPSWPHLIKFFAEAGVGNLQLNKGTSFGRSMELWTTCLGENPLGPCKKLQILNLSKNQIGIEGAKMFASALEHNKTIQFLDLSENELQVYGTTLLCEALKKNSVVKGLNLFKNFIDVDGSRAVREMLKVNKTLEWLDLGHNRIRMKGLEAIAEGINDAGNSNLKSLGLRMNFLADDGIQKFFDEVVFTNISKLENIYIKHNNVTQGKCQ